MIAYLATTHFDASRDLQETLSPYQKIYNYHVPQKNIGHITPIQALKDWHKKQPELFKKKLDYPPSSAARQPNLVASNPADIGKPGFLNDANQG
ncbi:hypothetical protein [Thiolapillus sp.]|uniref:hypothetical protein n=1 Tax=Thiolapillus sp. TaxID=2017437 RepID=UPI003AF948DA